MKKYINLLLIGFIIFVAGLIICNFEIKSFTRVNDLPENFSIINENFSIDIDENKIYKIKKAKYNDNIVLEKKINNSLDDEVLINIEHRKTSVAFTSIRNLSNEVKITFSNNMVIDHNDLMDIFDLGITSIKEKKIYNYNLLKYSKISIIGNEKVLEKIEIE